ncbi:methyltransferase [Chishuiella sp.]|uniref:tRNA1(Val) (adenine(37)-N6)-methyltransferase n=1 Tax=Chishuiella sp. TaxID=1969467 RepID=UPI0028AD7083|nr:methyltransferase [Chishuiella sp.]
MNRKPFKFKQFDIFQDKTAMKVGTDGVLLGSWTSIYNGKRILDIGTGTGLVALMLAQRFSEVEIDAIEIDKSAYLQASENFENSIFKERLNIYNTPIQDYNSIKKYDLVVSNPPFFNVNDLVDFDTRKQARQQTTLTFAELLNKTACLLSENGFASFIIPYDQREIFVDIALKNSLHLSKILYIRGNQNSLLKRVLLEFSFITKEKIEESELIIEIDRHQYTDDYINLTKDFYLKM